MRCIVALLTLIAIIGCTKEIDSTRLVERKGITYEVNSRDPYTGKAIDINYERNIVRERLFIKGLLHGITIEYYDNSQKKMEATYSGGQLHGIRRTWYKNGQLESEANYVNNRLEGQKKRWFEDGHKVAEDLLIKMETTLGTIVIDLYEAETPVHAANFKKLASTGAFEGIYFHRVIPGFVVQGGDPNTRDNDDRSDDGMGGIGERLPAEIGHPHLRGTLGAARDNNPEKKSSGSQFYFCLARLAQLDGNYTVFGKVIEGMDVVDQIATLERDSADNPLRPVTILKTSLVSSAGHEIGS